MGGLWGVLTRGQSAHLSFVSPHVGVLCSYKAEVSGLLSPCLHVLRPFLGQDAFLPACSLKSPFLHLEKRLCVASFPLPLTTPNLLPSPSLPLFLPVLVSAAVPAPLHFIELFFLVLQNSVSGPPQRQPFLDLSS